MSKAIEWVEQQADIIELEGKPLAENELILARRVGVVRPEFIRVLLVPVMPIPEDLALRQLAHQVGVLGPGAMGLTIGYGIYIRYGCYSLRVLSHECRHVQQFEQVGSIAVCVQSYLAQLIEFGYRDAPYEIDARNHEISHS